jgi:hypothetical protein
MDEVTLVVGLDCKFFVIAAWSTVSRLWLSIGRMQVKAVGELVGSDCSFAMLS